MSTNNEITSSEIISEEKGGQKMPAPTLNQACKTRRNLEKSVDLHETTQGERYLTAMIINPTIQYALTPMFGPKGNLTLEEYAKKGRSPLAAKRIMKKAIMSYMHSRYAAIPYQNYQQKMENLKYDFNRVFRYIDSEYRCLCTHPVSAEFELGGKMRKFTPTLTHECGDHIDVISIKLGTAKYTVSGRKNEYNRDMQLYEMVKYGRARGFTTITAQFLYLTRTDDVAQWNACQPAFFAGGGNNVFEMTDIWDPEAETNALDEDMAKKIAIMQDGIEEEEIPEDECAYCKYAHICNHTRPPKRIESEIDLSPLTTSQKITFSEKQSQIRDFDKGIMRVIATAGSGKTFTSMAHVVHLIEEKNVAPKDILLITFSNAGAKEMARKLKKMLGYDPTSSEYGMTITTFHGFFYDIVKDKWEELGFGRKPTVLDAVQRYSKIAELLSKNPIFEWEGPSFRSFGVKKGGYNDTGALAVVSDIFSQIKLLGKDYNNISQWEIKAIGDIPPTAISKVIKLYGKYEEYCKKEGLLDFDDMELLAFKVIENDPTYLEETFKFAHAVIDEFQDTSEFEMELVKRLKMLPTCESIMIVGDDDQSIYRFRGTSPEFILDFSDRINEEYIKRTDTTEPQPEVRADDTVEDIVLDVNFRSHQEIIDLGCKMLEPNTTKIDKQITAARGEGGFTLVKGQADKKKELAWLVTSIQAQHDHGVPWEDICVLAYKKTKLRDIADALTEANIPSMMGAPELMSENSRIDSILAFARTILDKNDTLDAANAAAALYYAEDVNSETKFMHLPNEEIQERVNDVLSRVAEISEAYSEKKKELFMQYIADIALEDEAVERFVEPFENLDFEEILKYCRDFTLYGTNQEFRRLDEYPGVKLITCHSSKGLEWPVVYFELSDFIDLAQRSSRQDIEELRRLMYVSMTRARDQLFVFGIFSKTGKKVGEIDINWALKEAYDAAGQDFTDDYEIAKAEVAAEKAAKAAKTKEKSASKKKKTA